MAISRFKTSTLAQGLPKYQDIWDGISSMLPPAATQIFIAGGNAGNGSLNLSYMYNIASDTYTAKASIPANAGEYPVAGHHNGSVYLYGGGYNVSYTANHAYNISTNSWTAKTSMPSGRLDNGYITHDNKIWQFGGKAAGSNATYTTNYYYDPVANTFTQIADQPGSAGIQVSGYANNKFYVSGGYRNQGSNVDLKDTLEYNISSNTWTSKAASQYTHSGNVGGSSDGTFLYAVSAHNSNSAEKYNISTNTWSNITNSPNSLQGAQTALLYNTDGKLYVPSNTVQTTTQVYSISGNSWTSKTGTTSITMQYYGAALVP